MVLYIYIVSQNNHFTTQPRAKIKRHRIHQFICLILVKYAIPHIFLNYTQKVTFGANKLPWRYLWTRKTYQKKRNTSTGEKISKTIQDLPDYMMRFVTHMTTVKNASILTVYEYVRDISIIFQIIMEINPVIKSKKDITVDVLNHLNTDVSENL